MNVFNKLLSRAFTAVEMCGREDQERWKVACDNNFVRSVIVPIVFLLAVEDVISWPKVLGLYQKELRRRRRGKRGN